MRYDEGGEFVRRMMVGLVVMAVCGAAVAVRGAEVVATGPAKKMVIAVLPFVGGDEKEVRLAEKMRFAVSQKLASVIMAGKNDESGVTRIDNVTIDRAISALEVGWSVKGGKLPEEEEIVKVAETLGAERAFVGQVVGRKLTVTMYEGGKVAKTATAEIPGEKESPKLAVEGLITELTGAKFEHLREWEADHTDPKKDERFAKRGNLALDGGFEEAGKSEKKVAANWGAILGADRYAPPLLTAEEAKNLGKDRVAIVPKAVAGDAAEKEGLCLMMRLSKGVAESNGLACESIWIPVEHGSTYRFAVKYRSTGPVPRLFLKGFAVKGDKYGDKDDPEAVRREFYRAQVAPRAKNDKFELIEMDFTPSVAAEGKGEGGSKAVGMKIEWLRVDLYIYLQPGDVFFDEVVVKKISE